jgi:hypothetical protein
MVYAVKFIGKPVAKASANGRFINDGLSKDKIIAVNCPSGFKRTPAQSALKVVINIAVAALEKQEIPGRYEVQNSIGCLNSQIFNTKNKNPVAQ